MTTSMQQRTVNPQQAAEYIGCSRSMVYKLVDAGQLRGYKFGGVRGLRIFIASVHEYIELRCNSLDL